MKTKTGKSIVTLFSLAVIGLSTAARADTILTIDFQFTEAFTTPGNVGDVFAGNLIFDQTTGMITGITDDFMGGPPDPNFTFANLNGGNPLFNVGDSAVVTAIPGTSQTITDSTSGVTLDWSSVTTNSFPCSACGGGVFYDVAYNGTGPGGGPNTLQIGGVIEANFEPGSGVIEIAGTAPSTPPTVPTPEPTSIALLTAGLLGLSASRKIRAKRGAVQVEAEASSQ